MKKIKKLTVFICIMIMLLCGAVIYISFHPELSDQLAVFLYGNEDHKGILPPREEKNEEESTKVPPGEASENPEESTWESIVPLPEDDSGEVESAEKDNHEIVENQKVTVIDVMCDRPEDGALSYEKPIVETVETGEDLKKKSGYEEVTRDEKEIKEEEASKILEENTFGETGEKLQFSPEFYPYYAMLGENQKSVYRQIYANAKSNNKSFIPYRSLSVKQIKDTFEAVYNDHPELFWLENRYSCKYTSEGTLVEVTLTFNSLAGSLEENRKTFEDKVSRIVAEAEKYESDYEKEKYVHDILAQLAEYDGGAANHQSAYSAIIGTKTVCAGYARAFQYIMQRLDIPCYYCTGFSGQDHAWNIVKLYGEYYNVDVTWDDTEPVSYEYYNKTDRDYSRTHIRRGMSEKLPACLGKMYGQDGIFPESGSTIEGNLEKWWSQDPEISEELAEYYKECFQILTDKGIGRNVYSVEVNENAWKDIENAYLDGDFKKDYLEYAINQNNASGCSMRIEAFLLKNGNYRLDHYADMWP